MRTPLVALGAVLFTAMTGCAETQICPQLDQRATIQEISGNDLRVRLVDSGEIAVLHVGSSEIFRKDPDGCARITVGDVTTGSNVAFHVDAWAESYPMQGWPAQVVVG